MANIGSMRGSKLTAAEAALLAGEVSKPSWQSKNEGIHERVSFEDSIWGFDLAGGLYYKTPLRVTAVKRDSRAEKAGIRPGDKLLRINDIDTSTMTIQEAHEMIIESGIHIRLAVSAPEDTEDSYNCYQDPYEIQMELEKKKKEEEEERRRRILLNFKVNENWSLMWPWVSKRRVIYRESNCYMVPSKYEGRHRDKYPLPTFGPKQQDDIVLHTKTSETPVAEKKEPQFNSNLTDKENNINASQDPVTLDHVDDRLKLDDNKHVGIANGEINTNNEIPMDLEVDDTNDIKEYNNDNKDTNNNEAKYISEDQELENWNPNENSNEENLEQENEKEISDSADDQDALSEEETHQDEANEEEIYEEKTNEEEDNKIINEVLNGDNPEGIENEI